MVPLVPLADRTLISASDGGYAVNDAARIAYDVANLGRELAARIKGHEAYRDERPGQVTAPRADLVATVRAIVERAR